MLQRNGRPALALPVLCLITSVVAPDAASGQIPWRNHRSQPRLSQTQDELRQVLSAMPDGAEQVHVVARFRGPLLPVDRERLRAGGLNLLNSLGDHAFIASHSANLNIDALLSGPLIGVETLEPATKLHPRIARGDVPSWAVVDPRLDDPVIAVYVLFHGDVKFADVRRIAKTHCTRIVSELRTINGLVVELAHSQIGRLVAEDAVQWVELPLPKIGPNNDSNRDITQADVVQAPPYDLDGSGVTVLVYDGGTADPGHPDFAGRIAVRDSSGMHDHSTHVAGTVGGDGAASGGLYRGMAPGVKIESFGFEMEGGLEEGFLYTDPGDLEEDYNRAINTYGADISNNSIGSNIAGNGFDCEWEGDYGVTASLIDAIVTGSLGEPFRIVWSAGNERGPGRCGTEYYTIPPPANNKNAIVVGALNSNDDSVTFFTSWGPSDDGRLKPDVCGPGCQTDDDGGVTSCSIGGGYSIKCGTSMSGPTVAGLAALLMQDTAQQFPELPAPRNATLKALLIHNAADAGPVGPDYKSGYGSVRIQETIDFARTGQFLEQAVEQGQRVLLFVDVQTGGSELKVTLAWDDVPGTPLVLPSLVNDLDLRVYDPAGVRHFPWTLDPENPWNLAVRERADHINNVEQVVVDVPMPGQWRIEVHSTNVPSGPQAFSLASSLPFVEDCNNNGIPDQEEIDGNPELDCTGDGVLDECEPDCNGNGRADSCDIAEQTSNDCDGDHVPDECQADCDQDGTPDICELPPYGDSEDCDDNDLPDECQDTSADCNVNGTWDACDVANGSSEDSNENGIPDECESSGETYIVETCDGIGNGTEDDPYCRIQFAIDRALPGDTVLIRDGLYTGVLNNDLRPRGKAITVRSENGPANCIIDCELGASGFIINEGETPDTHIEGLTVRRGYNNSILFGGAGIQMIDASPTIEDCVFEDNVAEYLGSGLFNLNGQPTVTNCVFRGNRSGAVAGALLTVGPLNTLDVNGCVFDGNEAPEGGAIYVFESSDTLIRNSLFINNRTVDGLGNHKGGGVFVHGGRAVVQGCTFSNNSADAFGGAIYAARLQDTELDVSGCILWGNAAPAGPELHIGNKGVATVSYSDVRGGPDGVGGEGLVEWSEGNVDVDPGFVDSSLDDYHIVFGSPCINAGDPGFLDPADHTDIDQEGRIYARRVDIGADEHTPPSGDCNNNGFPDILEIMLGISDDCNENDLPDDCDLVFEGDCNTNELPDDCDIAEGVSEDCNENGIPDECMEYEDDCNDNGIPDQCDEDVGIIIVLQPLDQDVEPGDVAVFRVDAAGEGLQFNWRRNGVILEDGPRILGSDGETLIILDTNLNDPGHIDCLITEATQSCEAASERVDLIVGGVCYADLSADGEVSFGDMLVVLTQWGTCEPEEECTADLDGDGIVSFLDMLGLLIAWGPCPVR